MTQFHLLSGAFFQLLTRAKLPEKPLSISEIKSGLRQRLEAACQELTTAPFTLSCTQDQRRATGVPAGLNTVGLLVDRLSILCVGAVKRGCTEPSGIAAIREILAALEAVQPGLSSVNTKQTLLTADVSPTSAFEAALWLLMTNTELWEAQEVLYSRGPESLPDDELRSYIAFFAHENVRRNELMQHLATLYWATHASELQT